MEQVEHLAQEFYSYSRRRKRRVASYVIAIIKLTHILLSFPKEGYCTAPFSKVFCTKRANLDNYRTS